MHKSPYFRTRFKSNEPKPQENTAVKAVKLCYECNKELKSWMCPHIIDIEDEGTAQVCCDCWDNEH